MCTEGASTYAILRTADALTSDTTLVTIHAETGLSWRPAFVSALMLCYNGVAKALLKGPRPYWLSDKVCVRG